MITYNNGDLLKSGCEIICHQVNLLGVMGGGLAYQIAKLYPQCEEKYAKLCSKTKNLLGEVYFHTVDENHIIANCFSQKINFDTNYESVNNCFNKVLNFAKKHDIKTIGVPFGYGSGIANGNRQTIERIINSIFENEDIELQWWKYN